MRSCAPQKNCCKTFLGGWKNSLVFLNYLSVDHMALLWLSNDSLLTSTDSILTFYWLYTDALLNLCWLLLVFRVTRLTRLAKGLLLPRVWKYDLLRDASTSKNMFSGLGTCEFEFLEAIPKELDGGRLFMVNEVLQFLREQDDWLNRDVTSCGESSPADLILNFILKVRMLRFLQHSRLKCNKSSF